MVVRKAFKLVLWGTLVVCLVGCGPINSQEAFFDSVRDGDIEAVTRYLDEGGNINVTDDPGCTPLHWAVNEDFKGSHRELVELLIERGADVNARDDLRQTPLHWVSNKEAADLLIKAGAKVNAKDSDGVTILYSSVRNAANASATWEMYSGLVKLLIEYGADVNAVTRAGETPLHVVARQYDQEKVAKVCELLIAGGARVNERAANGRSPLDEALVQGRDATAAVLRKHGGLTGDDLNGERN